jgi:hypothetical protein
MSKYGPVNRLYQTMEENDIIMSRDEEGDIVLDIRPKI